MQSRQGRSKGARPTPSRPANQERANCLLCSALSLSACYCFHRKKNSALAQFFVKTNIHPYLDPNVRPYFVLGPAGWPICPGKGRRTAGTIRKRPPRNWSPNTKCHFETHPSLPGFGGMGRGRGGHALCLSNPPPSFPRARSTRPVASGFGPCIKWQGCLEKSFLSTSLGIALSTSANAGRSRGL